MWLSLKRARLIVEDLEDEFLGLIVHEDHIIQALWDHPLYEDQMWLDVDWDDVDRVIGIHVGVSGGVII